MSVSGFLGPAGVESEPPSGIYLFVNGRPVTDRLLTRAVLEAYRSRLVGGRYPVAVIFLGISPEMVDVNVHPAKAEVRFLRPSEVFAAASDIMTRSLSRNLRPADTVMPTPDPPPSYRDVRPDWASQTVSERFEWQDHQGAARGRADHPPFVPLPPLAEPPTDPVATSESRIYDPSDKSFIPISWPRGRTAFILSINTRPMNG